MNDTLQKRFWNRVHAANGDECWEWDTPTALGYGSFRGEGAHRVAYRLTKGAIPHGMYVMHLCHNKRCCNPSHLQRGTPQENTRATSWKIGLRGRHTAFGTMFELETSSAYTVELSDATIAALRTEACKKGISIRMLVAYILHKHVYQGGNP